MNYNLDVDKLINIALQNGEGVLSANKALVINTGKYTGRSPDDKFIVDSDLVHNEIAWGNVNKPISVEKYNKIRNKIVSYLENKETYIFLGFAGADKKYRQKFKIVNELASQNLFIHQLLRRPTKDEFDNFGKEDYVIYVAPNFKCDPETDGTNSQAIIAIDYERHEAIIAGTGYCGEIKKCVFSIMNYVMVKKDVLPMHCSANINPKTNNTTIFFGLSGTGKTTLSADNKKILIGDDEHGWSKDSIFNFEGGCYAKCINLDKEKEPEIYNAIRYGSIVENVVMNPITKEIDFSDSKYTENTRVAYPIEYIDNATIEGIGNIPNTIIFLTADAFGVIPPISRLDKNGAMYHFITGFTSKVAGTEKGITKPVPTFSTLFGEPFMPLSPLTYANMLGQRLEKGNVKVFLINTGWVGGSPSDGIKRINLEYTRKMVNAAIDGKLDDVKYEHLETLNLDYPISCEGVPSTLLNPINSFKDKESYEIIARKLANMFNDNFDKKYKDVPDYIRNAGPKKYEVR